MRSSNNRIRANEDLSQLLKEVRSCTLCQDLPLGPKPILQMSSEAKVLIVGQAPGRITHGKGIPFDDPSGDRLRNWMGVDRETFYDATKIAMLPMGFCYPGTGNGGDLPPRKECANQWREQLLGRLENIEFTLIIGRYAIDWHLGEKKAKTLRETVLNWRADWPERLPMPHPSPRNLGWLKKNDWFSNEVLPALKKRIAELLEDNTNKT